MRRLYQAGALLALSAGIGIAPFATGCWGDQFTAGPPIGGIGGTSSVSGIAGPSGGSGAASSVAGATATTGGAPLPEGCGTATLMADADTYVDGMFADDNYDHKALGDDKLEIYQFGATSRRILIYFDVKFWIPANYEVLAARLELVLHEVPDSFGTIDVHRILLPDSTAHPAWDERFATWNRYSGEAFWTTPGGDFEPAPSASMPMQADMPVGTVVTWDVTTDVQAFYAGTLSNAGWLLKETNDPAEGLGIGYVFYGREAEVPTGDSGNTDNPDAGTGPGAPGPAPAPAMPDDAGDGTADAGTADAGTGDAGTGDAGAMDDGPGVLPRLLVDVCPI